MKVLELADTHRQRYSKAAVERSDCRDPKTLAEAPAARPSAGALRPQRSEGYLRWFADLGDPKGTLKSAQLRAPKAPLKPPRDPKPRDRKGTLKSVKISAKVIL